VSNVHAFWVATAGVGEVRALQLAAPSPTQRRVTMLFSGVSRGTEALVFNGDVPKNQHQAMRCPHQEGCFSGAVKYGYSAVGREEASGVLVFCLHPHQTHFVVEAEALSPLPDGLDPGLAVLAPNLETAINAIWDAAPQPDERITVIGGGVVGLLVAWRLSGMGHEVELVETNKERAGVAGALGVAVVSVAAAREQRDLIIHASGSEAGLCHALKLAAHEGRIIEMSWFGNRSVSLPLGEDFHVKRLTLRSSQVGTVSPNAPKTMNHKQRMAMVLDLLAAHPALEVLIDGESDFHQMPKTMARLASPGVSMLCHRIRYQESVPCTD